MMLNLKSPAGQIVQAKYGFSWTFFFFGSLVPLFRGDIKWFFITLILVFFTFGISQFVFMFIYNRLYLKDLLNSGYKPADGIADNFLRSKGLYNE